MRIALITSRPGSLAEFRIGLEIRGFRVECHGDAWGFLRTAMDPEWSLVILDGVGSQVRPFLEGLLEVESGLPVAVMTDLEPEAFHASVDGLGVLCPLPARPKAADADPLLDRLRAVGALSPEMEAAQARPATIRGFWLKGRGPLHWLQASLEQEGKMCARAWATFLLDPPGRRRCPKPSGADQRPARSRIPNNA
jgi:hypothetical protein